jgi:ABC-type phosphate transport system substrate-binding protein
MSTARALAAAAAFLALAAHAEHAPAQSRHNVLGTGSSTVAPFT